MRGLRRILSVSCQAAAVALEGSKQPVLLLLPVPFPQGNSLLLWSPRWQGCGLAPCSPNTLSCLPAPVQNLSTSLPSAPPHPSPLGVGPSCRPLRDIFDLIPNLPQAGPMLHSCFLPEDAPGPEESFWKAISRPCPPGGSRHLLAQM